MDCDRFIRAAANLGGVLILVGLAGWLSQAREVEFEGDVFSVPLSRLMVPEADEKRRRRSQA